ncbi:hypothetical protein F2Q70_00005551 [Brassica cretica]|uniref:Uncharacterized protein n=1 Tax=Brassica cretica TaxID=69181 RepID=A0A8S9IVP7_BRACR|nr:hypothetical protein F2Q70_00005551 [Brassica cretica]
MFVIRPQHATSVRPQHATSVCPQLATSVRSRDTISACSTRPDSSLLPFAIGDLSPLQHDRDPTAARYPLPTITNPKLDTQLIPVRDPFPSSRPQPVRETQSQHSARSRPDSSSIPFATRQSQLDTRRDQLQLATISKQSVRGSSLVGGPFNPS